MITDIRVDIKAEKVLASLGLRGLRHLLLRPWTFEVTSNLSWIEHGPVVNVIARSEVLRIGIGPNHVLAVDAVSKHLREKCPEIFGVDGDNSSEPGSALRNAVKFFSSSSNESDVKSDQHYIDDLRAGAFQYVEADNDEHTKPYQVIIILTLLSGHPKS